MNNLLMYLYSCAKYSRSTIFGSDVTVSLLPVFAKIPRVVFSGHHSTTRTSLQISLSACIIGDDRCGAIYRVRLSLR